VDQERAARSRKLNRWWIVALAVFVVLAALLGYMFAEPFRIEVVQYEFAGPQVPAEFDGTKIILLTDIHRSWFSSQERVRDLVEKVNGLNPDVVALAGDYVYVNTDYEDSCFTELAALRAPLGRFAVLGNHDYAEYSSADNAADPSAAIQAIEAAGVDLLDDKGVWLERNGARIRLGGVSDYRMGRPDLAPTVDETTPADLVVLLCHNPDYAETLPANAVDLMLSGHTHGGQVTFFGLWAPYLPSEFGQKYRTGMVRNDNATVIVSNGIGTIFPPLRFFARPQIVEITLRHADSPQ
jgi:predicted MPP superfamily phosphohydrolase